MDSNIIYICTHCFKFAFAEIYIACSAD